ncbi:hypothetical protein NW762_005530 [Fusarium torreyae]|uniref:Uncharacterized protein n=1 Tax=Fusarium torreyae TaxID=1237075 RepID=A0A9W8VIP4_9HYPO|nr:hypothetical protein NW762_005530 [Fusarium torreyae]
MPRHLGDDGEIWNRRRIRHRNGRRTRKGGPKQDRTTGLTNAEPRDQDTSDRGQHALNTQDRGHNRYSNGTGGWRVKLGKVQTENERYIDPDVLEDDNLVYFFMTKDGQDRGRFYQAELVDSFCRETAFQELRSSGSELSQRKVCLIDDRTNDGKNSASLGDFEPLSVHEMYLKLMEKRFHLESSAGAPIDPSVDRRLIFVTDPDSHGMAALMATAPLSQVDVLSDFFYHYVAFKPYIGDSSQSRGFPTFTYSFHLPFYSWACTRQEPRDLRATKDGSPLRCVHNMSFLGGKPQGAPYKVDYLCKAQVSVLIASVDHTVWTGFGFADTHYQPEDWRQSVDKYLDDEMRFDPFTDGKCDADKPFLDPGEYFLTCLDYQSKLFKNEWVKTAWELTQKVKANISDPKFGFTKSSPLTYQESHQPLEWLGQTRLILNDLEMTLDTTINCWDNFASKDQFSTPYGRRCLASIDQTFGGAKNCLKELKNIGTLCDGYENTFKLHTTGVGSHAAHGQAQAAERNLQASYIQLFVS